MKKLITTIIICLGFSSSWATEKVSFTVDESKKAEIDQKIAQYQAESKSIIQQAEAEITQAEKEFATAKKEMETQMAISKVAIQKAHVDAQTAKERFERIQIDTNSRIEAANKKIHQASQDLTNKLDALKQSMEIK